MIVIHGFSAQNCDVLNRQVSYKCIPGKPKEKIRVCEGGKASIDCPKRSKISIEYANYGRMKGAHVCGAFSFVLNKNCGAENSMAIVERDCKDQNSCQLEANNDKFGDPCWGTQKYLEVSDFELFEATADARRFYVIERVR